MRSLCLAATAMLVCPGAAAYAQTLRLGVSAPLSGGSEILGRQIRDGAGVAAAGMGGVAVEVVDDGCTADGGAAAARRLVQAEVRVVVGFLCQDALAAAMPIFKDAGVPVITVGVRTDSVTDERQKTGWPVYRLGPRADGEQKALAALLPRLWANELFAIVDDGTIYGRELAESFRLAAEQAALKPVYVDTFRPQLENQIGLVGRLRRAGATHVFVGGDRDDVAIMARDAAQLEAGMVFAGGEALRAAPAAVPLTEGTVMIGLPEWSETANPEAIQALLDRGIQPEGYALPAYAAMEMALIVAGEALDGGESIASLAGRDFQTAIGPIRFEPTGDLSNGLYRAFRYDGTGFVPLAAP